MPAAALAVGLASGIGTGQLLGYPESGSGWAALLLLAALALALRRGRYLSYPAFLLLACLSAWGIGLHASCLHHPPNRPGHFSRIANQNTTPLLLELDEKRSPGYYQPWTATLLRTGDHPIRGKILLEIPREVPAESWQPGDLLLAEGLLEPFRPPANPHAFPYKNFMETRGIWGRIRTRQGHFRHIPIPEPAYRHSLARFRSRMGGLLEHPHLSSDTSGLLKALLLGNRSGLDPNLSRAYQQAGVAHLLAVSGLHVGILSGILALLLRPIRILRQGRGTQVGFTLCCLWGYAWLAGFSASIVRASVLFSLLALALLLGRGRESLHFLALAALILLALIDPQWLFQPGFQMSFAAVWAILHFYPALMQTWLFRRGPAKAIGAWTALSLSAQVGVLPISLYYFHQFPTLFLVSNLLLVPFVGLVVSGGLLVLGLRALGIDPPLFFQGYDILAGTFQAGVSRLGNLPGGLVRDIPWDAAELALGVCAIGCLGVWIRARKPLFRVLALTACLALGLYGIGVEYRSLGKAEWVVPHRTKASGFWYRKGKSVSLFTQTPELWSASLRDYRLGERTDAPVAFPLGRVYRMGDLRLIRIDSSGGYPIGTDPADIVLLSGSPRVHLERVLAALKPQQVIADGSNYNSYTERWRETCRDMGIPFHHTAADGAFILKPE